MITFELTETATRPDRSARHRHPAPLKGRGCRSTISARLFLGDTASPAAVLRVEDRSAVRSELATSADARTIVRAVVNLPMGSTWPSLPKSGKPAEVEFLIESAATGARLLFLSPGRGLRPALRLETRNVLPDARSPSRIGRAISVEA